MLETAWSVALDTAELTFYFVFAIAAVAGVMLAFAAIVYLGAVALVHVWAWVYYRLPVRDD